MNSFDDVPLKFISAGKIYRCAIEPHFDDAPQYDCFVPCDSGDFIIVDCWICDENQNVHPDYREGPVPVYVNNLGKVIGLSRMGYNTREGKL